MNTQHHHISSSAPARATVPQIRAGAILESLSLHLWTFCCPVYSPPPHPTKGKPSLKISEHPLLLSFLVCYSLHYFLLTLTTKLHLILAVIPVSIAPLLTWLEYLHSRAKFPLERPGSLLMGQPGGSQVSTTPSLLQQTVGQQRCSEWLQTHPGLNACPGTGWMGELQSGLTACSRI